MTAYVSEHTLRGEKPRVFRAFKVLKARPFYSKRVYQFQKTSLIGIKDVSALSACSKIGGKEILLVLFAKYTVPIFLVLVRW